MAGFESRRFAIDAMTALRSVRDNQEIAARHRLVGPSVSRSHVLSLLFRQVRQGTLDEKSARQELEGIASLKIRLLGDRVSRATAWKLALQLGWDDTKLAEYLAVATLQADALIPGDAHLVAAAANIVPLASYEELFS